MKRKHGHWEGRHWISDPGFEPEWMKRKYPEGRNPNFDPDARNGKLASQKGRE